MSSTSRPEVTFLTDFNVSGGFGSSEGARKKGNKVKSSFVNFQTEFGKIMLEKKMGSVKKLFM